MALLDGTYDPLKEWFTGLNVDDPYQVASVEPVPSPIPPLTPPQPAPAPVEVAAPPVAVPPIVPEDPVQAPEPMLPPGAELAASMPVPVEAAPEPLPTMQPGLGIPADILDPALAGQMLRNQGETLGEIPAPEIEFTPDQGTDFSTLTDAERDQLGEQRVQSLSDVELAQELADVATLNKQTAATKLLEEATASRERAEETFKIGEDARVKAKARRVEIEAEAKRNADEQITPEDWYDEGGPGRVITSMIMAIGGGLVQHLNGGRNIGLDMIDKSIDRYIATKQADRAAGRQKLNDDRQAVSNELAEIDQDQRQAAVLKAAAWEEFTRKVEIEQMNFDPKGTQWRNREVAKREAIGRQAKALMDQEAADIKRMEAEGKSKLEIAEHNRKVQKDRDDAEAARKRLGVDYMNANTSRLKAQSEIKKTEAETKALTPGVTYTPAQLAELYPGNPVPKIPMDQKQYDKWLEGSKKGADVVKVARENSPEERAGQLGAGDLTDDKGQPLLFRDSGSASRIAKKRGAVDNSARLIDQLIVARKKYGWSTDLFKSPEWLSAQSDMGSLIIELKNDAELGALSGPDMGLVEKIAGTKDPTELRDPLAGLEQARSNTVNNFNGVLGAEARPGQKPKRYEPPKFEAAVAEERGITQNLDIFDAPEIDDPNVNIEIRKRAAVRAVEGADATSRKVQSDPGGLDLLKMMAGKNAARAAEGLVEPGPAAKAQIAFRKRYRNILKDLAVGGKSGEVDPFFGAPVTNPRAIDELSDDDIDARMGVGGAK